MMLMTDDRQEILTTLARTPDQPRDIYRLPMATDRWSLVKDWGPGFPGGVFRALQRDGLITVSGAMTFGRTQVTITITPAGLAAIA